MNAAAESWGVFTIAAAAGRRLVSGLQQIARDPACAAAVEVNLLPAVLFPADGYALAAPGLEQNGGLPAVLLADIDDACRDCLLRLLRPRGCLCFASRVRSRCRRVFVRC